MSPAVITETVWALCSEKEFSGTIRVIPITTSKGAEGIKNALLAPAPQYNGQTVWQALRSELKKTKRLPAANILLDQPAIISTACADSGLMTPLDDIRSIEDNQAVAEFLLDEVRKVTENPSCKLVASLAGGRKTMGAMLQTVMGLLARTTDRLTHVLVNEPYDSPALEPRFYFPAKGTTHHLKTSSRTETHPAARANICLADVPVLRLRELFPQQFGQLPGRFSELISLYSNRIQQAADIPTVTFDNDGLHVQVNDTPVRLSAIEYALYCFMARRCHDGKPAIDGRTAAAAIFQTWLAQWGKQHPLFTPQNTAADTWQRIPEDDLRRKLNTLRSKLAKAGLRHLLPHLMPIPRGPISIHVILANP